MAVGRSRSGMLTAGGVLAIISGALGIIGGLSLLGLGAWMAWWAGSVLYGEPDPTVLGVVYVVIGIIGIIVGFVAIVGGMRALQMKSFGWALTGGICALLCAGVLGILALVFIAMSKAEFEPRAI